MAEKKTAKENRYNVYKKGASKRNISFELSKEEAMSVSSSFDKMGVIYFIFCILINCFKPPITSNFILCFIRRTASWSFQPASTNTDGWSRTANPRHIRLETRYVSMGFCEEYRTDATLHASSATDTTNASDTTSPTNNLKTRHHE